jgi:hypothetical protein
VSSLAGQLLIGAAGGLVAAIVTSLISLRALHLNLDHAKESDRLADARRLRDERRERLRKAIEPLLKVSLGVGQVVRENQFVWQSESLEQRNERHFALLKDIFAGINDARVSLMIQEAGRELVRVFDLTVLTSYQKYMSALAMNKEHPGTVPYTELDKEQQALIDGIEELRAKAQQLLDDLDKPI